MPVMRDLNFLDACVHSRYKVVLDDGSRVLARPDQLIFVETDGPCIETSTGTYRAGDLYNGKKLLYVCEDGDVNCFTSSMARDALRSETTVFEASLPKHPLPGTPLWARMIVSHIICQIHDTCCCRNGFCFEVFRWEAPIKYKVIPR